MDERGASRLGFGSWLKMTAKPIAFWIYVAAGVAMIIASTLAMPFIGLRGGRLRANLPPAE